MNSIIGKAKHNWPHKLPSEEAVAFELNGINYAVMMASPFDLEDYLFGFLFTEGIINSPIDVHHWEVLHVKLGTLLKIELANRCIAKLKYKQRALTGNSGCGICGTQSLAQVFKSPSSVSGINDDAPTLAENLKSLFAECQHSQHALHSDIGDALHAAAWVSTQLDSNGRPLSIICREDIGRHNALDKVLGSILKDKVDHRLGYLVITSRCSAELVQKTIVAGISTLVCFASPSTLAIELARKANLKLVHLPKNDAPIYY